MALPNRILHDPDLECYRSLRDLINGWPRIELPIEERDTRRIDDHCVGQSTAREGYLHDVAAIPVFSPSHFLSRTLKDSQPDPGVTFDCTIVEKVTESQGNSQKDRGWLLRLVVVSSGFERKPGAKNPERSLSARADH